MNSEILLDKWSHMLMAGRNIPLYGTDKEADFFDFMDSIRHFHLQWLRDEIKRTCDTLLCSSLRTKHYIQAFKELASSDKRMFKLLYPGERQYNILEINTFPKIYIYVGYGTREPVSPTNIIIADYYCNVIFESGRYYLSPSDIINIFSNIDAVFKERTKDIITSGLKELVPETLKKFFVRGRLNRYMGNSDFSDNSCDISHEMFLKATDTHNMAYTYLPDYFLNPDNMKKTFENVEYSYWALSGISSLLPEGVDFICQHRDDCGVSFAYERTIGEEEYLRRKAVLLVRDDRLCNHELGERDYADIMRYCGLEGKMSIHEFVSMCDSDMIRLDNHEYEIKRKLGSYADKVTLTFYPDCVAVYLLDNRDKKWRRECFLKFDFYSDLSFLDDMDCYMRTSDELVSLFNDSNDYMTTVGLLTSTKKGKKGFKVPSPDK